MQALRRGNAHLESISSPAEAERGGHRHRKNRQALVCVNGVCEVIVRADGARRGYRLDRRDRCLVLEPQDWHEMRGFSVDSVLLVLASEPYDPADYVRETPA